MQSPAFVIQSVLNFASVQTHIEVIFLEVGVENEVKFSANLNEFRFMVKKDFYTVFYIILLKSLTVIPC
jgi:hypothetical protein